MRILHVVPSYLPAVRYGGPIVSVHGLCRALVRRGHDVHVFTTNADGDGDSDVPLHKPVVIDGVIVRYFETGILRRLFRAPEMRSALNRDIATFSVLHTHSVFLWPTWAAARCARTRHIPYLLAPRGMLVRELIRRRNPLAKKLWIRLIERRNLEGAAGIHVTSHAEAAELGTFGLALPPIHVVPNGVDLDVPDERTHARLPPAIEAVFASGRQVLLYIGRISWEKGLDRLIAAVAHVPDAALLVIGNDETSYSSDLAAMATAHGVAGRVLFGGPVYGAAKTTLYRRATAFVLPSYSENFGNVVLEALAAGCPVVVTPEVGASSIVTESGGGMVVAGEPAELAAALRSLLESADRRREMVDRGRSWVSVRYSWDSVASSMDAVYSNVIHRGAA